MSVFSKANVFENSTDKYVSMYIFARDNRGIVYFGMVEKIQNGARDRFYPNGHTGAAGTKPWFFGKWVTPGGCADKKSRHILDACAKELKAECGIDCDSKYDFDIPWIPNTTNYANRRMFKLIAAYNMPNNKGVTFIIYMKDSNDFFNIFPRWPMTRGGAERVNTSGGEIGNQTSMNMEQIMFMQNTEMNKFRNNFFTSYVLNTLNTVVIPTLRQVSETFWKKWRNGVGFLPDKKGRNNVNKPLYIEVRPGIYIDAPSIRCQGKQQRKQPSNRKNMQPSNRKNMQHSNRKNMQQCKETYQNILYKYTYN